MKIQLQADLKLSAVTPENNLQTERIFVRIGSLDT